MMRARQETFGFTLIETILVLAIVGIVMGAIWAGYASVSRYVNNTRQEQQISGLLTMARDYLQRFNENNGTYYSQAVVPTVMPITQYFVPPIATPSLLPSSVSDSTANPILVENGTATITTFPSAGNPYGTGPLVGINLAGFDQVSCQAVVNDWGGSPDRIQSSGLVAVIPNIPVTNSVVISAGNLFANPVNLTKPPNENSLNTTAINAATTCSVAAPNTITLLFRLNK